MSERPSYEECREAVELHARYIENADNLWGHERLVLTLARVGLRVMEPGAREKIARAICRAEGIDLTAPQEEEFCGYGPAADAILSLLTESQADAG